jgi:uncharacterized Zn finger protein (UPF0148 family)
MGIAPVKYGGTPLVAPAAAETCERCGGPVVRRRAGTTDGTLCASCRQRARRAAYFQRYYAAHRERILEKNRRWARENRAKLAELRQARQERAAAAPRQCVDCGARVVRAARCRRCYIRYRYATDPDYRSRRLATTRRWLERRRAAGAQR